MRRGAAVLALLLVIAVGMSGVAWGQTGMNDPSPAPSDRVTDPSEKVSSRPPIENPDQGVPVVPVVLAVVALGAVVLAIRQPWNRS